MSPMNQLVTRKSFNRFRVMTNLKRMVGTDSHRSFQNDILVLITDSKSSEARTKGKKLN